MGKRKTKKPKPASQKALRIRQKLDKEFLCYYCQHERAVSVKLDRSVGVGYLKCRICGVNFSSNITSLDEPIDVFTKWMDTCRVPAPTRHKPKDSHSQEAKTPAKRSQTEPLSAMRTQTANFEASQHLLPQTGSSQHLLPQTGSSQHLLPQTGSSQHLLPQTGSSQHLLPQTETLTPAKDKLLDGIEEAPTASSTQPLEGSIKRKSVELRMEEIVQDFKILNHSKKYIRDADIPGEFTPIAAAETSQEAGFQEARGFMGLFSEFD